MQEGLNTEQGGELGRGRHSSNSSCHIMGVGPSSIQWEKLPLGQRGKEQEGALRIYILFVYASTTPHDWMCNDCIFQITKASSPP